MKVRATKCRTTIQSQELSSGDILSAQTVDRKLGRIQYVVNLLAVQQTTMVTASHQETPMSWTHQKKFNTIAKGKSLACVIDQREIKKLLEDVGPTSLVKLTVEYFRPLLAFIKKQEYLLYFFELEKWLVDPSQSLDVDIDSIETAFKAESAKFKFFYMLPPELKALFELIKLLKLVGATDQTKSHYPGLLVVSIKQLMHGVNQIYVQHGGRHVQRTS